MTKPVIESAVPVPRTYFKYPFSGMKVGDSFLWAGDSTCLRSAAANWRKRHAGFKFTTRKVDGGVRLWRIK